MKPCCGRYTVAFFVAHHAVSVAAVAGLPEPRDDHAVVMARFAQDCLQRSSQVCKGLETVLGPDTGDLGFRIGLHSGQVTAGVLRGDKGRFQLFGDTVNTASRIETTGVRNKIHCSQETAELLKADGREKWLTPREDQVHLKGKGVMKTYFVRVINASVMSGLSALDKAERPRMSLTDTTSRLVKWNVEVLSGILKRVAKRRAACGKVSKPFSAALNTGSKMLLDEVQDVISLPPFNGNAIRKQEAMESFSLEPEVMRELYILVNKIAHKYRDNAFHNFEHASHVSMSVVKMMSRIVDPKEVAAKNRGSKFDSVKLEEELHDHTFGITSDPLTQFACAFSALIHDVDHQGVPNSTLVNEESPLAIKYKYKSVAEQNSVDLAWDLLIGPDYENLRNCICADGEEFRRFRQLVVNSVMVSIGFVVCC